MFFLKQPHALLVFSDFSKKPFSMNRWNLFAHKWSTLLIVSLLLRDIERFCAFVCATFLYLRSFKETSMTYSLLLYFQAQIGRTIKLLECLTSHHTSEGDLTAAFLCVVLVCHNFIFLPAFRTSAAHMKWKSHWSTATLYQWARNSS